jgi:hypothetical protein
MSTDPYILGVGRTTAGKEADMSQTDKWNILDSFFAFRARQLQRSMENRIRRQMKRFPPHLADDVNALPAADEPRAQFKFTDGIHKIYSFE